MEMITCQDLAKILQKMIDIFHPIEMMPCQDLVTYFQNIARIANAVQVTICLLVSTSVY